MNQLTISELKKDKLYDYLKENSHYIKKFYRNQSFYNTYKKEIKEKYNLRLTDKVSNVINDIELISNIISNIN